MSYRPTPVRMAVIKKVSDNKVRCEDMEPFRTAGRNANLYIQSGKLHGGPPKLKLELSQDPAIPLLHTFKETVIGRLKGYLPFSVHFSTVPSG